MYIIEYLIGIYLGVGLAFTLFKFLPSQFKLIKKLATPSWLRRDYFTAYITITLFTIITYPVLWVINLYGYIKGAKKNV